MATKFTQIIPSSVQFEIIGFRRKFLTLSSAAFIASLVLLFTRGMNLGIDFSGGTEIQVDFSKAVPAAKLRQGQILKDLKEQFAKSRKAQKKQGKTAKGELKYEVQRFGQDGRGVLFKFAGVSFLTQAEIDKLKSDLLAAFPNPKDKKNKSWLISFHFRTEGGDKVDLRFKKKLDDGKKKKGSKKKKAATTKPTSKPAKKKINDFAKIRDIFKSNNLKNAVVEGPTSSTDGYEYSVSFAGLSAKIAENLGALYGAKNFTISRVESVGPRVGKQLRNNGILAILLANLFILIYIAIRFDFRYAPGAVAALLHDVTITTGVFSALWLPFDLSIIAALLTIIGYSLNDTIVVYDRIRENWQKSRVNFGDVMNRSINETLSRTLLTSITTFLAVIPIYLIGGSNIRWFAFSMMFGILIGTYSSIAIASPIVYFLNQYFSRKGLQAEEEMEEKRERRRRRRAGLET